MGTVYARGRKLWIGFQGPDGKWLYRSSGYAVGQELLAEKLLREIEESVRSRGGAGLSYTVLEYATRWAKARVTKGKHTNAKLDAKALENHVFGAELEVGGRRVVFGRLDLAEVRLLHVRALLEHLEAKNIGTEKEPDHLAPRTRRSLYSLVKRFFDAAMREELLARNPCQLERAEQPQLLDKDPAFRDQAVFSQAELERLISDERLPLDRRVFYAIAFLCGMREGEIAALRWDAYDPAQEPLGMLYVRASFTRKNKREKAPKSGWSRRVPVHPAAAALLAQWRLSGWKELFGRAPKPGDLLVPNRAGRYVTDLNITENFGRDLERLGLRHRRFHDSKRTFVSLARAGGAGGLLKWVSHGPSKTEMQDVYSTPPWEALCREVLCIKAQLRGEAVLLPLKCDSSATGSVNEAAGQVMKGRDADCGQSNRDRDPRVLVEPLEALTQTLTQTQTIHGQQGSDARRVRQGPRPTTFATTIGGSAMEATVITNETKCPGRDSKAQGGAVSKVADASARAVARGVGASANPIGAPDRSTGTTVLKLRRPFRGGMQIDDEPDPHPASSTAGVRRG